MNINYSKTLKNKKSLKSPEDMDKIRKLLSDHSSYDDENFYELEYSSSVLETIEFSYCNFEKCEFTNSSFINCRFHRCKFIDCDLSNANVFKSRFTDTYFKRSKLVGVNWTAAKGEFMSVGFFESNISYCNFADLKIPKTKFINCKAIDADFTQCDLSGADFEKSNVLNSKFHNTNLSKARFVETQNYAIDPRYNKIRSAKFSIPQAISLLECFGIELE